VTPLPRRVDSEPDTVGRDLGRLVLTIVELVRQLMERQALRRVEAGDLPAETVERLGLGLMHLEEAMAELREHFGLQPEDLNVDLGPLGALLAPPDGAPGSNAEKSHERDQ
jgi:gas vesicle protein GvpK